MRRRRLLILNVLTIASLLAFVGLVEVWQISRVRTVEVSRSTCSDYREWKRVLCFQQGWLRYRKITYKWFYAGTTKPDMIYADSADDDPFYFARIDTDPCAAIFAGVEPHPFLGFARRFVDKLGPEYAGRNRTGRDLDTRIAEWSVSCWWLVAALAVAPVWRAWLSIKRATALPSAMSQWFEVGTLASAVVLGVMLVLVYRGFYVIDWVQTGVHHNSAVHTPMASYRGVIISLERGEWVIFYDQTEPAYPTIPECYVQWDWYSSDRSERGNSYLWVRANDRNMAHLFGISFERSSRVVASHRQTDANSFQISGLEMQSGATLMVAAWMPFVVALVLPACVAGAAVVRWRQRRRQAAGLCGACGYDLRASPERCPECGLVAQVQSIPAR